MLLKRQGDYFARPRSIICEILVDEISKGMQTSVLAEFDASPTARDRLTMRSFVPLQSPMSVQSSMGKLVKDSHGSRCMEHGIDGL